MTSNARHTKKTLGAIPLPGMGAVTGAIDAAWIPVRGAFQDKILEMKINNCQQLHENYATSENLPEMSPPGGSETTDLNFLADNVCDPVTGQ